MEEVPVEETVSIDVGELIGDQVNLLLATVSRPAVQIQLLVIVAIVVIALAVQEIVNRRAEKQLPEMAPEVLGPLTWRDRIIAFVQSMLSPLVATLGIYVSVWLFQLQGQPFGLLEGARSIILVWLAYRIVLALLYARFGEAVRPYHRRVFIPLLGLVIILMILRNSLIFSVTFNVPILSFAGVNTSLGDFIIAGLTIYAFAVASWIVEQALTYFLPQRIDADPGVINSVSTLVRYALLALGILVALGLAGFNASSLAIVAGGLSVGIGIGLQEIVANFVSGLTLLVEQSLRPGDVIELDGRINTVEKISLRSTTVRTLDNTELIIPNATFTTSQVNNLTRNERLIRVRIPFGVAYGSDIGRVRQVARDTALENDLSMSYPPPIVLQRGFGDSALNFELAVWMSQPEKRESYRSDLYYRLLAAFNEHGIRIPFPQRDIHFPTGMETAAADQKEDQ